MLLWCSISVSIMLSPRPMFDRPQEWAARLIASVVPRTKIISDGSVALHGLSSDPEDRNIVGEILDGVLDVLVVLFWTTRTGGLFFALRHEAVAATAG